MPSAFICVVLVGVSLIFHSFTNSRSRSLYFSLFERIFRFGLYQIASIHKGLKRVILAIVNISLVLGTYLGLCISEIMLYFTSKRCWA